MNNQPPPITPSNTPGFGIGMLIGFVLFLFSLFLAFITQGPGFFIGVGLALLSLCFRGYRGIFVGFALPIGLIFLFLLVVCGPMLRG